MPRTRRPDAHRALSRRPIRAALAALLTAVLVTAGALGAALPAAAMNGVTATIDAPATTHDGTPVMLPGQDYNLRIQYENALVTPGGSVDVTLPEGVAIPDAALGAPVGAGSIADVSRLGDGRIRIQFKPVLDSAQQGIYLLKFQLDAVERSEVRELEFDVDGATAALEVVVKHPADVLHTDIQPSVGKSAGWADFASHISVVDGEVVIAPSITTAEMPYTLSIDSAAARPGFRIADTLDARLELVPGSVAAVITTWDADGLNRTVAPWSATPSVPGTDGASFSFDGVDVPADSRLTVTYRARIVAAEIAALRDALQAKLDALDLTQPGTHAFTEVLENTAVFGPAGGTQETRRAPITVGDSVTVAAPEMPNPGAAFSKRASLAEPTMLVTEDGDLAAPLPVDFTLGADLRQWDERAGSDFHSLDRDVVVTDTLPSQATWKGTITVTDLAGDPVVLAEVASAEVAATAMSYAFAGQTLTVNLGRDHEERYTIVAPATLTTVVGLPGAWTGVPNATAVALENTAVFDYSTTRPAHSATSRSTLVDRGDTSGGVDDDRVFDKSAPAGPLAVNPGDSLEIPYTFRVNDSIHGSAPRLDVRDLRIVDAVDPNVFDVTASTLPSIRESVVVTYHSTYLGPQPMPADAYELTLTSTGELSFELTAVGDAWVVAKDGPNDWDPMRTETGQLILSLTLPTKPILGKQTVPITNRATLIAAGDEVLYFSENVTSGSSYGSELEVVKRAYDPASDSWTSNLRIEVDEAGALVRDTVVYRVDLVPHGDFVGSRIIPITDVLPAGLEFLGFVPAASATTGADATTADFPIGGNVVASWDAGTRTIELINPPGTSFSSVSPVTLHFSVRIDDFLVDTGITNRIGASTATITPSNGFPIVVTKLDAENSSVVIDDRDARFTLRDAAGEIVFDDIFVADGQLVREREGRIVAVAVAEPGRYTLEETTAPAGYERSDERLVIEVGQDGSSPAQRFYNTPDDATPPEPVKTYAIGDVVWVDADEDGAQGDAEVLAGVTVTLLGADGTPVAGVAPVVTNEFGEYVFDALPAGDYRVRFALTPAQAAIYAFTTPDADGVPDADDSDARPDAENPAIGMTPVFTLGDASPLTPSADYNAAGAADGRPRAVTASEGIDPTWDAGVVLKPVAPEPALTYAIGDVVWIDENSDGVQDAGERPLVGVLVTLLDAAGEPIAGVEPVRTDADGRYLFDALPAGEYRVRFELTPEQSAIYRFTTQNVGDAGTNSDASPTTGITSPFVLGPTNPRLTDAAGYPDQPFTATGGIDPTWDAGVQLIPDLGTEPGPTSPEPAPELASSMQGTGSALPMGALLLAAGLLAAGAGIAVARRRTRP